MKQEMKISFPGGRKVNASFEGFDIESDQLPDSGGEGSAPEPYTLFLASLATCAGTYAVGFCQKRELPVDGIDMTLSWEREPESRRMARINITVITPPSFPEKYHKALERSINQCAVKKTILDPPEFVIEARSR